jgi:hypothetical protein
VVKAVARFFRLVLLAVTDSQAFADESLDSDVVEFDSWLDVLRGDGVTCLPPAYERG